MPILASLGAGAIGAYRLFRGGAAPVVNYIEDVFSTYLYTGNGSTQTITNGIDLSGKGGMVWIKSRNDTYDHFLYDTARGATKSLQSDTTSAEQTYSDSLTAFNSNGFALGANVRMNANTTTYASWTFRKQAKFFDVVTYSGNGINGRQISHNLGSTPGTIIVKVLNAADNWPVWHRSAGGTLRLDSSEGTGSFANVITTASSTTFTVTNNGEINGNGYNYVAYIFAHDAGGFGLSGTDNVITCGSFSSTGSGGPSEINLGYEPQWVMLKTINSTGSWTILDNMRGWVSGTTGDSSRLFANLANAESVTSVNFRITSTGFTNVSGTTNYIYIAIRRGPMKTPTSGTSVFTPTTYTGNGTRQTESAGFPTDMAIITNRGAGGGYERNVGDRLRGGNRTLFTRQTVAENTATDRITAFDNMVGVSVGSDAGSDADVNGSSGSQIAWNFRRAPGFFDVVCYTGTGSNDNKNHNLTVVPELIILKARSSAIAWYVMGDAVLGGAGRYLSLNTTAAYGTGATHLDWTSTTFSVGSLSDFNGSGTTYVSYLFATVAGVSKVGSYTGNGSSQTINCGFAAGARFVMIKRTDSTGDWYVWDTARGIVAGNDPRLSLNSTAAEVTTDDSIDPDNSGFIVNQLAATNINVTSATYIFLAIA